jgi:hypothetical protein
MSPTQYNPPATVGEVVFGDVKIVSYSKHWGIRKNTLVFAVFFKS